MSAAIAGSEVAITVESMFSMNSATATISGTRRSVLMDSDGLLYRPCRALGHLSPLAAGESHMDLSGLLHCFARRILKTTPGSWRESDGQIQEGFSTAAGPARRERQTQAVGGPVHRSGGRAVR